MTTPDPWPSIPRLERPAVAGDVDADDGVTSALDRTDDGCPTHVDLFVIGLHAA